MGNKVNVVSLFSGIGGFEKGLEDSNLEFNIVFASEIDKYAKETYSANFQIKTMHGDIKQINEKDVPNHDLLCGGFPCQSFSVAGKQEGFGDLRGTLFFDIIRIIREKKPRYILLENVKNLISHDKGKTIQVILKNISDCGYTFDITVINSHEAGLPQNRERTYIVGVLNHETEKFETDKRNKKINEIKTWANQKKLKTMNFFNNIKFESNHQHILDVLENNVDEKYYLNSEKVREYLNKINEKTFKAKIENRIVKEFDLPKEVHNDLERQRRVYSPKGISPTLLARSDMPKIIIKENGEYRIRKITPYESLKIQGFDSKFVNNARKKQVSDTQLYKQAGNAVSPPVITKIVNSLKEQFHDEI